MNKYKVKLISKDIQIDIKNHPNNPYFCIDSHCDICKTTFNLYGSSPTSYIVYEISSEFQDNVFACSEECVNMFILSDMDEEKDVFNLLGTRMAKEIRTAIDKQIINDLLEMAKNEKY